MHINLKYGLITGIVYSVITLILFFVFGNSINFTAKFFLDFILLNVVLYIFLYFPIKHKINSLSEQRFYYGEGMKYGFTTALVASIVIVIFIFIFYKFINTGFFASIKQSMIPEINGTSLDSLKKTGSIKTLIANSSPVTLMLQQFSFTIISGMIASFLLAAFISKKKAKQ
ncbi:MAG: DUF4199 domain-containing protein [Bacteroidetes bacterium]|nr:DUF4199 domain-containing protein [Bacteroidota bacterium]